MLINYGIKEVRKIRENEEAVTQLLSAEWVLLDVFHCNNAVYYVVGRVEND